MHSRKIIGIICGSLILLILGLLFVNWIFILFIVPLILYLFIAYISFNEEELKIKVKRSVSREKVYENDKIDIKIDIENKGKSVSYLEIYDNLPKKVEVIKGSNYAVLSLKKNEKISLEYTILCKIRGFYPVGPIKLRTKDFFEIFYKDQIIDSTKHIMTLPYLEEIRNIPLRARANLFPGAIHARQAGIGTEFYGLRRYLPGDSFKHINWKSLARFNNLMVNEFSLESTTDIIIILDSREIESMGTLRNNPLEYSIKAAGSLASFFLNRRDRVGLISYGKTEKNITWVYPESGKKQLYKIIENLVQIEAYGSYSFISLIDQAFSRMIPKKSLIFFISSLQNDQTISEGLEKLNRLGFNTIVLSPSSIDIEKFNQELDQIDDISYKILGFERRNNISRLRNSGAIVIDWNPKIPLVSQLEEVAQYQLTR